VLIGLTMGVERKEGAFKQERGGKKGLTMSVEQMGML
jgi:hypothetical protein